MECLVWVLKSTEKKVYFSCLSLSLTVLIVFVKNKKKISCVVSKQHFSCCYYLLLYSSQTVTVDLYCYPCNEEHFCSHFSFRDVSSFFFLRVKCLISCELSMFDELRDEGWILRLLLISSRANIIAQTYIYCILNNVTIAESFCS